MKTKHGRTLTAEPSLSMTNCTYTSQCLEIARHTNDLRSILPAPARMAVDIEIHVVEVCREKGRSDEDIGHKGEGMMEFMGTFVIGLLLALREFGIFLAIGKER